MVSPETKDDPAKTKHGAEEQTVTVNDEDKPTEGAAEADQQTRTEEKEDANVMRDDVVEEDEPKQGDGEKPFPKNNDEDGQTRETTLDDEEDERETPYDVVKGSLASLSTKTSGSRRSNRTNSVKQEKLGHRRVIEGKTVYKKTASDYIKTGIQMGIRHAIGSQAHEMDRDVLLSDFDVHTTFDFPCKGTTETPAHRTQDFSFTAHQPFAYRYFRKKYGIEMDDFMVSVCNEELIEITNPGASGSIFYKTSDDSFLIKTVSKSESMFLQKLLPGYFLNLAQNLKTLLPKFFGLYTYQAKGKNIRVVVMNNILPTIKYHEKYDLKGSLFNRKASEKELRKSTPTLKDLDWLQLNQKGIMLEKGVKKALLDTLKRDTDVMRSFGVMDYSLLVGIHNIGMMQREGEQSGHKKTNSGSGLTSIADVLHKRLKRTGSFHNRNLLLELIGDNESGGASGIPAVNKNGELLWIYVGIIDILQRYKTRKKVEHAYKAFMHDGKTVSVCEPRFYAERFINFMCKNVFGLCDESKKEPGSDQDDAGDIDAEPLQQSIKNFTTSVPHQYRHFSRKGSLSNVGLELTPSQSTQEVHSPPLGNDVTTASAASSHNPPPPALTRQSAPRERSKLGNEMTESEALLQPSGIKKEKNVSFADAGEMHGEADDTKPQLSNLEGVHSSASSPQNNDNDTNDEEDACEQVVV